MTEQAPIAQPEQVSTQTPTQPVQVNSQKAGVNKYFIILILVGLVLLGGVLYKTYILPASSRPVFTGQEKRFRVIAIKDEWRFEPEVFDVVRGDKVIMEVVNEDEYDHGIAIDAFGVSQRMPAKSTITLEFFATQEGDFPFYCSVPCGEGEVEEKKRTHFDMIGTVKVRNAVPTVTP